LLSDVNDHSRIINADESCWRVYPGALKTWVPIGSQNVHLLVNGNEKDSFNVIPPDGSGSALHRCHPTWARKPKIVYFMKDVGGSGSERCLPTRVLRNNPRVLGVLREFGQFTSDGNTHNCLWSLTLISLTHATFQWTCCRDRMEIFVFSVAVKSFIFLDDANYEIDDLKN
jgi:hypothetical protein